ncbi:hypothetical protein A2U01_0113705, partial [Trifolium medium]|nr:hypothetical protein [Trifolium medium]
RGRDGRIRRSDAGHEEFVQRQTEQQDEENMPEVHEEPIPAVQEQPMV